MRSGTRILIVNKIELPVNASFKEAFSVAGKRLSSLHLLPRDPSYRVYRRSVDARRRDAVRFVYSVAVEGEFGTISDEVLGKGDLSLLPEPEAIPEAGEEKLSSPPVVVGSGPCGLFAALLLAEAGYAPVILERGGSVAERRAAVEAFAKTRVLDADTNIQFGAGGAGTFSDGKLITRIHDPMSAYVLRRFVEFGAPEEVLYLAKPHIGTDILSVVVSNMLDRIVSLGGRVLYHTAFLSAITKGGAVTGVKTSAGELPAGALILAIGHSARDTYENLMEKDVDLVAKDFSVGMRIEHLASAIDCAMYGDFAGHPALGHAEYTLSANTRGRGVYTFCMCPGGSVVAATSECFGVVTNGMSEHGRAGKNSNSAVACSVFKEDYGGTPKGAIAFQRKIEHAAFAAGGSDYSAPIITVGDFLSGETKLKEPKKVLPTYMDGGVRLCRPEIYLPDFVTTGIARALSDFDRKIPGFADPSAVLTGAETRTSAPIRILRDPETRLATGYANLYPAGEGAGYAGGITSAAVDGIRTAFAVLKRYSPVRG